jgi:hypothetical protein
VNKGIGRLAGRRNVGYDDPGFSGKGGQDGNN